MKLWEVWRFEVVYRLRRISTWAYLALFVGLVYLMVHDIMIDEARGSGNVWANAPILIAVATVLTSMIGLVATAELFGDAAARDVRSRMHPLVYTSPLGELEYLAGRFLAAFTVNALLLAVVPVGLAAAQVLAAEPELYGPFRIAAYLQPYLVFALPNLFAAGALTFAAAALTGRALAGYGTGAFLFFASILNEEALAEHLEYRELATLLDPFGFTALSELFAYWTPFERSTQLLTLAGPLLWNRLLWLALGAGVLSLLAARFRFTARDGGRRSRPAERRGVVPETEERTGPVVVPRASRAFGPAARARQVVSVARRSFAEVAGNRYGLLVFLGSIAFVILAGWDAWMVLDTPTWPVTYILARGVVGEAMLLVYLLITLYAGHLVWMERDAGTSELTDAAPYPAWVPLAGKLAALVGGLVLLQAIFMGSAILLQAVQGYHRHEPGLYLQILFGIQLPDYVLVAVFALLVHVLVNHKYLGHVVVLLYLVLAQGLIEGVSSVEHNLLLYPSAPGWSYSDLSGFEPFLRPHLWFKAYWGAWALVFAVAVNLFWVRGREGGLRGRLRTAQRRFTGPAARWSAVAGLLVLATGGFVFYNTNILHEYRNRDDRNALRADYERRYKRYQDLAQPRLVRSDLEIEIYPEERRAELGGTHRYENQTESAIDAVHLLIDPDVEARALDFGRPAEQVLEDEAVGYRIFELADPLQPGQSLELRFDLVFASRGFPNSRIPAQVVANGTYFERDWLPVVGYQPELELSSDEARRENDLPPRERLPSIHDLEARRFGSEIRDAEWIAFEAVIGTSAEQIAVAPGALRRTWTANGRRYFHYRADAPIPSNYGIFSAEYSVLRERWRDVDVEIFHHPAHTFNLDRMVAGVRAALDYHAEQFGPYPHGQLRIVEFPRHAGSYARAFPNTIAFSEAFGFLARAEEGIDYPFLVTVHEVAHQWWGNQLKPARVEGGPVLAETLAHYGAVMVLEEADGREPVRRFLRLLQHNYLVGRQNRRTEEAPLLLSNDQKYIHYDKGAVVMYALRQYVGEERVNRALRRLFEAHRFGEAPFPTTLDLYRELQAVTPDPLQYLLRDLFEDITLWELRTEEARAEPTGTGEYRVSLEVEAYKLKADAVGRDERVPMDDLIEIGVFAAATDGEEPGEPLYLEKHRIRSGEQTIVVTVPREPARAGIDPYHELIDRDRKNNLAQTQSTASGAPPRAQGEDPG